MRKENIDVVGDKPVKNDAGKMSMSEEAKQNAWAEDYERLLNVEFEWDPDHLSNEPLLEGLPIPIAIDMVKKAVSKMKSGKAAGPSGIVMEMIKAAGDTGATMIRDLATAIIHEDKVPTDCEQRFIVCLYKGKGDAMDRGNYRGLKLTKEAMKILERIVDGLIRQVVSIDDSQLGFVPGSGTTDAIFVVRQLQEKYLAVNKRLYMAFVDLEKAFRPCLWKAYLLGPEKVRCWGMDSVVSPGDLRQCTKPVSVGEGYSQEFEVKVGIRQGSIVSPLFFTIMLEVSSHEFSFGVPLWSSLGGHMQMISKSLLTP